VSFCSEGLEKTFYCSSRKLGTSAWSCSHITHATWTNTAPSGGLTPSYIPVWFCSLARHLITGAATHDVIIRGDDSCLLSCITEWGYMWTRQNISSSWVINIGWHKTQHGCRDTNTAYEFARVLLRQWLRSDALCMKLMKRWSSRPKVMVTLLPLFWKNKRRLMRSPCCLSVSPASAWKSEQWSQKRQPLVGNGLINMFPRQRIHTQQQKDCWKRCFICGPCCIECSVWSERTVEISSSQKVLFALCSIPVT
jgi:hypothetical protein